MTPAVDTILAAFLRRQREEGLALSAESDLLELTPLESGVGPADRFVATFRCNGLVQDGDGSVRKSGRFDVGIWFPEDYLRRLQPPGTVLHWFGPPNVFHPNIRFPHVCAGAIVPATRLVDLLYQVYEMITYTKLNCADALNPEAAAYARGHLGDFPVDRRPLKRRRLVLNAVLREESPPASPENR